ncbi:MAG: hypothetical protein EXR62_17955 [Chloroflexi bacterium]|nr:hypothetical protein [Chloroflexota bacterium]
MLPNMMFIEEQLARQQQKEIAQAAKQAWMFQPDPADRERPEVESMVWQNLLRLIVVGLLKSLIRSIPPQ